MIFFNSKSRKNTNSSNLLLLVLIFFGSSASVSAETNSIDLSPLTAIIRVDGAKKGEPISSLATSLRLLHPRNTHEFINPNEDLGVNFVFSSIEGAIVEGAIQRKAISFLRPKTIQALIRKKSNSDVCFVDKVRFSDGGKMTVGIYNDLDPNELSEDIFKCFTVSLWYHYYDNVTGIEVDNWRGALSTLFLKISQS